jgi:hypothetical protein
MGGDELVLAAGLVDADSALDFCLFAIPRESDMASGIPGPEHTGNERGGILQGEVHMTGPGMAQAGDLACYKHAVEGALEQPPDF